MFWYQFQTLFHAHSFWLQENSQAKAVVVLQCLCRAANCRRRPFGMDLQPLGLQNAPTAVIPLRQSLWSRQSSTLTRKIRNGAVLHGTLSPIFGMENTKSSYVFLRVLRSVTFAMFLFFQFGANDRLSSNIQSARLLPDSRFSLWHGGPLWMCFLSLLGFPKTLGIWILWRRFPMISLHSKPGWQRFPRNLFGEKAIELDVEATNLSALSWECTNLRGISWCTAVPCRRFLRDMARLCWGAQMLKLVLFWIVLSLSLALYIYKEHNQVFISHHFAEVFEIGHGGGWWHDPGAGLLVACSLQKVARMTWDMNFWKASFCWSLLPYVPFWKSPDTVGSDVTEAFVPLLWS